MEQIRQEQVRARVATPSRSVLEMVRWHAVARPNAPAVTTEDGTRVSYGELLAGWERLACGLRRLGVAPEVPVAVRLDRTPEMVLAMLGVLEVGGVYVPIDASCPPQRLADILTDLGAPVLLSRDDPPPEVAATGVRVVAPSDLPPEGTGDDGTGTGPAAVPDPERLAYVLHTSGTTGRPKGVAMPHRGLSRLIEWQVADGDPGLVTASFTATGFDVIFQETLSTLATGGRLHLLPDGARRDPERLLACLDEGGVERLFLPYVALEQLARACGRLGQVPSALRHVVTAGERLVVTDPIRRMFEALRGCRLDNHYGPTETHLVTSHTLGAAPADWPDLPPIGSDVAGVYSYLLDADLSPVPVGQPGEVYVGGDAVARGYPGDARQTAERFLPDPFSPVAGQRMYRTGDLARLDEEGRLHFLGRSDEQLKVRGYRVEPAEVERALSAHPRVRAAAVGLRQLADDVTALVAYLVPQGEPASVGELTAHLARTLPSYMIPSRLVPVDALPLTASGKVDRRLLAELPLPAAAPVSGPPPASAASHGAGDRRPAPEQLSAAVAAVWRRVLGHDEFEDGDDFFDIGGDSLLATWVVTELGQLLGRPVELSLLLSDSTLKGLATNLATLPASGPDRTTPSEVVTLRPGPSGRVLFLFHALGGQTLAYRDLARAMTGPVRVLGVQWVGPPESVRSLSGLADVHAEQLLLLQPTGSFLLAGWSFGGVLALEVARRLIAAGRRVDFLGLLDAHPARDPMTGLPPARTPYLSLLTQVTEQIGGAAGPADLAHLADDPAWVGLMGPGVLAGLPPGHLKNYLALARNAMRALTEYAPQRYPDDVELFQADATDPGLRAELARQLQELVCGEVRVRPVPGDHTRMLVGPQAAALAAALDEALDGLETRRSGHGSQD